MSLETGELKERSRRRGNLVRGSYDVRTIIRRFQAEGLNCSSKIEWWLDCIWFRYSPRLWFTFRGTNRQTKTKTSIWWPINIFWLHLCIFTHNWCHFRSSAKSNSCMLPGRKLSRLTKTSFLPLFPPSPFCINFMIEFCLALAVCAWIGHVSPHAGYFVTF